jgi:hypothetical protein
MEYPTSVEVETCLKNVATEVGDSTATPFRVDILPVYGGKPPMYTVVILSPAKERLRQGVGQILNRSFSLGVGSFTLKGAEAAILVSKYGRPERDI